MMRRFPLVSFVVTALFALLASSTPQVLPEVNGVLKPGIAAAQGQNDLDKMGKLAEVYAEHQGQPRQVPGTTPFVQDNRLLRIRDDKVLIDATGNNGPQLRRELEALGLTGGAQFERVVSGWLPISAIDDAAALANLALARPSYARTRVGRTTSQGDAALRAQIARARGGLSGRGVKIGVLSDSYNCLGGANADVASGDLPVGVQVLAEISQCRDDEGDIIGIDEGRAMLQLIHDVAPGAGLAFHTAFEGLADFAQGIIDLADAGATVIVDDVGYFDDAMLQDGVVARAVNIVAARGVAYFSSAGNDGRNSYESAFRPGPTVRLNGINYVVHDFDPGPGVDPLQRLLVPPQSGFNVVLQWDAPFRSVSGPPGANSDLDVYLIDASGRILLAGSLDSNLGSDPVEIFGYFNNATVPSQVSLFIGRDAGANPNFIKYIVLGDTQINEYATNSPTLFGHPNAAGAIAVGAADYRQTPAFGVNPARLRPYSSAGGVPIVFEPNGTRKAQPEVRQKPEVVGPDGTNTTFFPEPAFDTDNDGFPNFEGTSASAPQVAAVAALLREANPSLSLPRLRQVLIGTAADMNTPGFDFDSGFGFVRSDAALQQLLGNLALSGSVAPASVEGGGSLRYTIGLRNDGGQAAGPTALITQFNNEVEVLGATVGTTPCADAGVFAQLIRCNVDALAANAATTVTLTVRPTALGTLTANANVALVQRDAFADDNGVTISATVAAPALSSDLGVTITATETPSLTVGAALSYTVQVINNSTQAAQAITLTLRQQPRSGLTTASGDGWSCTLSNGDLICTRADATGSLPPLVVSGAAPPVPLLRTEAIVRAAAFDSNLADNRATTTLVVNGANARLLPLLQR